MARPPRLDLLGVPLHVIQRGVNRGACFFNDTDRRYYLRCLAEFASRHGCAVHAYVLMTNHVHLLLTPAEKGAVAALLQDLGRKYVRVINSIHGRTGTLWEGRFKSSLVDTEKYLLICHRYIELNPVRAGMVADPAAYSWSSHLRYARGQVSSLLTAHCVYDALGANDTERQAAYRSLFAADLDARAVDRIRDATNAGCALGSQLFMAKVAAKLGRPVRTPTRGRPPKERASDQTASPVSRKLL